MEDVYVLSAVRTPIGKYGGGLASVPPCDLAALVVREAVGRSGADPCQVAVAGGAESMSRAPYWLPGMRWGQRMNDGVATDPMTGALTDPFDGCHMGVTAENVAADFHVSRADQDALAVQSHRRAAAAATAGYFAEQIVPVEVRGRKSTTTVEADEHVRPGGISLGHPVGATGAILAVKALHELRRTGGRYALVTMCIGGGQGIAAVFERM